MLTNICSHHVKFPVQTCRRYGIRNHREIPVIFFPNMTSCGEIPFFPTFGEIPNFSHFWRNPSFIPLLEKSQFYPTFGEIPVLSHFWRNPSFIPLLEKSQFYPTFGEFRAFFKTSVFFKKIPRSKFILEFPV